MFTFGGKAVNPIPVGIAIAQGRRAQAAMKKAVANIYANGTMTKILAKWNMSQFALKEVASSRRGRRCTRSVAPFDWHMFLDT